MPKRECEITGVYFPLPARQDGTVTLLVPPMQLTAPTI